MNCKKISLGIAIITLSACGGGGGGGGGNSSTTGSAAALQALTISGVLHTLSGAYDSGCLSSRPTWTSVGTHDIRYTFSISSRNYTDLLVIYSSNNGSCTGGITKTVKWEGMSNPSSSTAATSGWETNAGLATTAPLANNGTSIGNTVSYTPFTFIDQHFYINNVESTTDPDGNPAALDTYYRYFIVDDTVGGPIKVWINDCDVALDTHCKAFPSIEDPLQKL